MSEPSIITPETIKAFLSTKEGLLVACFVAGITAFNKYNVTHYPIRSIFQSVFGATITSNILWFFTPEPLRLYASSGILGLSFIGLIHKIFKRNTPDSSDSSDCSNVNRPKAFIKINYKTDKLTDNELALYRVSYSTHKKLQNDGVTISIDDKLTKENILSIIETSSAEGKSITLNNTEILRKVLNGLDCDLPKIKGIFIHDSDVGYIMINTNTVDNETIASIRID